MGRLLVDQPPTFLHKRFGYTPIECPLGSNLSGLCCCLPHQRTSLLLYSINLLKRTILNVALFCAVVFDQYLATFYTTRIFWIFRWSWRYGSAFLTCLHFDSGSACSLYLKVSIMQCPKPKTKNFGLAPSESTQFPKEPCFKLVYSD